MATYSRRVRRTTRIEFVVPAPQPYGACWAEVSKAVGAIYAELREAGRLAPAQVPADDVIRVQAADDAIIVSYGDDELVDT